jgi:putative spermidine/putrescine transport system substrate-binding protein
MLIDDSVDYCICLDGRTLQAIETNPDWGFTHQGGQLTLSYLTVTADSPNLDIALELIDFTTRAEQQAIFVEELGYSGPNPGAIEFLPEELKPFLSTSPENAALSFQPTAEQEVILAENAEDVARAWDEWISQ